DSRHLLGLHNTGENGGETECGDEISRPMLSGVPLLFCQRFSHMGRGGNAPVRRLVTFKEALHLLIGQLPECEPPTHRLLPKGARPPPYYRSQCLREPTAAAWLGVGYSFNSLYGQRFSTRPLRYAVSHPRLVSTTSRRYRPRCRFPTRNAWLSTVTVPAMLTR